MPRPSPLFLSLVLGLAFLLGCEPTAIHEERSGSVVGDTAVPGEIVTRPIDLPQLSGYWVTSDYLLHLEQTGSPRAADEKTPNLTTLTISLSGDTLWLRPTPMCATEWEQRRAFIEVEDGSFREIGRHYPPDALEHCGDQCESLRLKSYSEEFSLTLASPTRSGLSTSYSFLAPLHAHEAPHYALAAVAQERFLTGTFRDHDGDRIVFTSDGYVSGLRGASRYIVSTYFCEEMSLYDTDIVILSPDVDDKSFLPDGSLYAANRSNGQIVLSRVDWPHGYEPELLGTSLSTDSLITLSPANQ